MVAGELDLRAMEPEQRGEYMRDAVKATLDRYPDTAEARGLVEALSAALETHHVETGKWTNKRGAAALTRLKSAVAAVVGDLLCAPDWGHWGGLVYQSMQTNAFTDELISADSFRTVFGYLEASGLVEHFPGFRPMANIDFGDGVKVSTTKPRAARFRATPRLLSLAEAHGVLLGCAEDHFPQPPVSKDEPLVVLKSVMRKVNGKKVRGASMPIEGAPDQVVQDLETIRDFLADVVIEGGKHRQFKRQFEEGDRDGFAWDRGGRLYSLGDRSYQQLKKGQRLAMCLNGEPVAEIDIRASHLMILHGRSGTPIDLSQDPYDLPGLDRSVVKTWVVASITNGAPLKRWLTKHKEDFAKDYPGKSLAVTYKPKAVEAAVTIRLPILRDLENLAMGWAELQFVESEAIIATMLDLIREGVPSLPIHDSLLVPVSKVDLAERVLKKHFQERVGIEPWLEVRTANQGPPEAAHRRLSGTHPKRKRPNPTSP